MNFAKFLRTLFLQNTSGGCFCSITSKVNIFQNKEKIAEKYVEQNKSHCRILRHFKVNFLSGTIRFIGFYSLLIYLLIYLHSSISKRLDQTHMHLILQLITYVADHQKFLKDTSLVLQMLDYCQMSMYCIFHIAGRQCCVV